jgi:hypothetical protein
MGPKDSLLSLQEPAYDPCCEKQNLSTPSLRSIFILSSQLCLGLPSELFLSGFMTTFFNAFLLSHVCYAFNENLTMTEK